MSDFAVLGKSYPRIEAREKVTGHTKYASDVYLTGMLMCKLLTSTRSHARIVKMDTAKAEELPGVRGIVTGEDFPDARFAVSPGWLRDRKIMVRDKVRFLGEPIAAVAADDETTAQEALDLIEVEYEDLEAVIDPLETIRVDAPVIHPDLPSYDGSVFSLGGNICNLAESDRGDVDQAFSDADHVFEDTFRSQAVNQGFIEPMACVANFDANGRLTVWTSTQGPYLVRAQLGTVLGIPRGRIKVVPMEVGGSFGAKYRLALEAYPSRLASKTGRPVKLVATRKEMFTINGPRLATNIYLKTGVTKDGRAIAREAYTVFDVGGYMGPGPDTGVSQGLGAYNIPNYRLRSYGVYTNKIFAGSYRASGAADMDFAVESHMDIIARKLRFDPVDFRTKNAVKEGDTMVGGLIMPQNGMMQTILAVKERMGLPKKLEEGRGVGIAVNQWRNSSGPSTAAINLSEDGSFSLLVGSVDLTGSDTALAQIAAETLGTSLDQVVVPDRDTDLTSYNAPSAGNRTLYSQGKAVQMAAEDARQKLFDLAAGRLGVSPDALACRDGRVYVEDNPSQGLTLGQLARMAVMSRAGPITGVASLSSLPYVPSCGTQAVEVLVDKKTGQVKVTRFVQAQDVGVAINPSAVEGQMEGGAVQGIGRALTEEILFDPSTGRVRNPSLATYLLPLATDLPPIESIVVEVPCPDGPFGARGAAEVSGFGPPAAIANAVHDAVGVRIKDLPITAEKVLAALQGQATSEVQVDVDALRSIGVQSVER